jgi:RNA polymerase sigma-70 factor (sigma-E family)
MTVIEAQEAMRAAYEEHYVLLLRLCILLSGDRQVAEDIVQDAFVRIAPRIGEVPAENMGPYLRRVVVNLWKNRLRSLTRERRARDRSAINFATDPTGREDGAALRSAVLRLPKRQRACLILRYYEDLPEREVASLLGCSLGTVKSQTSRALDRLRKEFESEA